MNITRTGRGADVALLADGATSTPVIETAAHEKAARAKRSEARQRWGEPSRRRRTRPSASAGLVGGKKIEGKRRTLSLPPDGRLVVDSLGRQDAARDPIAPPGREVARRDAGLERHLRDRSR